jgi:carbon storage regulator CsrA
MLALTRRVGEEIVIGDPKNPQGLIRVVDIHGDKVRLAFDFPRETQINRRELAEQKARGGSKPKGDNGGAGKTGETGGTAGGQK